MDKREDRRVTMTKRMLKDALIEMLKKKDIYRMFTGEILVITFITAIPGIAIMYFALTQMVTITYYIEGMYIVTPVIAAITFAIILVFNLLAGLIPVFSTMRKTPAQILARTDI